MKQLIVNYVRLAAIAVAAFVVCACARLGGAGAGALAQPRLGDPPVERDNTGGVSLAETEAVRMDELDIALTRLDNNITELKRALALMGPLPDRSGDSADAPGLTAIIAPGVVHLSADAASRLFFETDLVRYLSRPQATPVEFTGASPRYRAGDMIVHLTGGAETGDATAKALCVELSALAGSSRGFIPLRAA